MVACEQALRGTLAAGHEKEGQLAPGLQNLQIYSKNVYVKCWMAEMTTVMPSLP